MLTTEYPSPVGSPIDLYGKTVATCYEKRNAAEVAGSIPEKVSAFVFI
jgi:hypothetical protein